MATRPIFESRDDAPDANSARATDMLDVVAGREINRLSAAKAVALELAHRAYLEQDRSSAAAGSLADRVSLLEARFNSAVLGERSFRAEVATLLNISERAAENLIGVSGALVRTVPETLKTLGDGDISWRHATIMVDETAGLQRDSQERLEHQLLSRPAPRHTPRPRHLQQGHRRRDRNERPDG